MIIKVLGCSGSESIERRPPGYLLDDTILLDAGTVCSALSHEAQARITHIFVTHSHLDHIRGIPILADNIITSGLKGNVTVCGLPETLDVLKSNIMNDLVWPDFSKIPSSESPVISYQELTPGKELMVNGYSFTPYNVPHAVPACGYRIAGKNTSLFYTGDTGPTTEGFWNSFEPVDSMIIETSFPDHLEELAIMTGHLTPSLLKLELEKMPKLPSKIGIVHLKPYYLETLITELESLNIPEIRILNENEILSLNPSKK